MTDAQHKARVRRWLQGKFCEQRLARITEIIEGVDNRCLAADGPVSDTRAEMTAQEMREIYWCSIGAVP